MPSVNMISPRRQEKKRLEKNVRTLLIVILAEAFVTVGVAGLLISKIYRTQSKASDLQAKITQLQPTVKKIEYYQKAVSQLKPKLETLGKAKEDTLRWQRVLDDLSVSLPDKTWLTRLTTEQPNGQTDSMLVAMSGVSASQEQVGDAMLRIQKSVTDFERLDLHFTQKSAVGSGNAVEFEIAAAMKMPKEDKDKKEVEKS